METLVISGGRRLRGAVRVAGGKNSSLAVIAAAALAADVSTLENVPHCRDVLTFIEILEALGVTITIVAGRMTIDARGLNSHIAPYDLCRSMRASFYMAGVLLGRACGSSNRFRTIERFPFLLVTNVPSTRVKALGV